MISLNNEKQNKILQGIFRSHVFSYNLFCICECWSEMFSPIGEYPRTGNYNLAMPLFLFFKLLRQKLYVTKLSDQIMGL
jgi:hypothetical protein